MEPTVHNDPVINWYAIQVRPRCELSTARILEGKGFRPFVPLYKRRSVWSDRKVDLEHPLFPCYIFCLFDAKVRMPIMTTLGVVRIVGTGKMPWPIEASEIEAIQRVVQSECKIQPHRFITVGTRVLIETGPLAGIEGIVTGHKNRQLILSMGLIQRSVSVELDEHVITALPAAA